MTMIETGEEEILLPLDAVPSRASQENYPRLFRWFLEFGGFIDPCCQGS
jgi:hypothetical protein